MHAPIHRVIKAQNHWNPMSVPDWIDFKGPASFFLEPGLKICCCDLLPEATVRTCRDMHVDWCCHSLTHSLTAILCLYSLIFTWRVLILSAAWVCCRSCKIRRMLQNKYSSLFLLCWLDRWLLTYCKCNLCLWSLFLIAIFLFLPAVYSIWLTWIHHSVKDQWIIFFFIRQQGEEEENLSDSNILQINVAGKNNESVFILSMGADP